MRLRIFISTLCLGATLSLSAQDTLDYTPLAERLADYGKQTMAWNIDGLLDLTAPELFDAVPRPVVREQMAGLSSNADLEVNIRNFTVDSIGAAIFYAGAAYVPVTCHHDITFSLRSEKYRAPDFSARMVRMLEKSYDNVRFDAARHQIEVTVYKSMFGIRPSRAEDWFFVEYRPENVGVMDLVVPPAVREQL